jgi:4,5-DOPA dioxygenase extradiol
MESIFISHGSPALTLEPSPARDFLTTLGRKIGRPAAIVCASAHWLTRRPALTGTVVPETIHDFYGFPDALYRLNYPAPGAPEVAAQAAELIRSAGLDCDLDPDRGIDHGVWVPLSLMYPEADIPVVQVALQPLLGTRHHVNLGRALTPLLSRGIMVIGSGGASHNLGQMRHPINAAPPRWVADFDGWLTDAITAGRIDDLVRYRELAPFAAENHPSEEHILPLMVAAGAAAGGGSGRVLHASYTYGVLSMSAFAFDGAHS